MIRRVRLTALAAGVAAIAVAATAARPGAPPRALTSATSDYVEHCGGCHGIQGSSRPARVPSLRGKAGYFLCTKEGREYLIRLPNVARSTTDDEQLAAIMNFIAFEMGKVDLPGAAPPLFTPAEIAANRPRALSSAQLTVVRDRIVRGIVARCKVPRGALDF